MKYQAVIFDLFGTLVDIYYRTDYYSVLREMISILKTPHDDFMKLWHSTAEKRTTGVFPTLEENLAYICRELNMPATSSQINLAKRVKFNYVALALTPRADAIEVLSRLKSDGYKKDCLYIGDGDSHELTGAASVGMHPVLIRASHEDNDEALRSNPEIDDWAGPRIRWLKEVLDLLK